MVAGPRSYLTYQPLLTDAAGRVIVSEFLAVDGTDGAWAPGDRAAVPDVSGRER